MDSHAISSIAHPRGTTARFTTVLLLLLAGGGALRVLGMAHRELWHDEYCSLLYATAPDGTIAALRAGGNPPLYFLLLRAWTAMFGVGEGAVRLLSALASTLSLGTLALWLRSLGLSERAVLWSVAVGALTPLHIFYAREARAYALVLLILTASLWALTEALRRGSIGWWGLYGGLLAAGFYTHNLLVPFALLHWGVALLLGAGRGSWRFLLGAQGLALAAYAPWTMVLTEQPYGRQGEWIVEFWKSYPPWLAIPRTLLAFGLGGPLPSYIAWLRPSSWVAVLSALWTAAVSIFAVLGSSGVRPMRGPRGAAAMDTARASRGHPAMDATQGPQGRVTADRAAGPRGRADDERRILAVLLLLVLVPLSALWLISALVRPVYVVGRYDLAALPAFLGLMGVGIESLQRQIVRVAIGGSARDARFENAAAWTVLLLVLAILFAGGSLPRYRRDMKPASRPDANRAALLARFVEPNDLLLTVDLAAASVLFHSRARGIEAELRTFPRDILSHWGWFDVEETMRRGRAELLTEAESLIVDHARAHQGAGRVWILPHVRVLDPPGSRRRNPRQEVYDILLEACRRQSMAPAYPSGATEAMKRAGILPLKHDSP